MKGKTLVIIQITFLIIGALTMIIGQYLSANIPVWAITLAVSNVCFGIGIGIAFGTHVEKP